MIKLLHSSDWHLGKSLFAKSLIDDQKTALDEISEIISDEKPDLVLLSGDIYDRSVPPEEAVKLFDRFLARTITEQSVPVVLIPGNHDSSTRVGVAAELLRSSGLHVFSTAASIATPFYFRSPSGEALSIYGVPFLEPSEWSFHFGGAEPLRTHADALRAIVDSLKPSLARDRAEKRRSVLLLHAFASGGDPSESERPLAIGGSDLVSIELLSDFDYVALGHLHRPQKIGSEKIRYSGSLLPYSQSETGHEKGVVIASIGSDPTEDSFRFRTFTKTRRLRVLRGTLEELVLQQTEATKKKADESIRVDDYVIAMLTDHSLPFEAFRTLNAVYPSLLHVGRDVSWQRGDAEEADAKRRALKRETSDPEILSQFISAVAAHEISDADREWLLAQLEEFSKSEEERSL